MSHFTEAISTRDPVRARVRLPSFGRSGNQGAALRYAPSVNAKAPAGKPGLCEFDGSAVVPSALNLDPKPSAEVESVETV